MSCQAHFVSEGVSCLWLSDHLAIMILMLQHCQQTSVSRHGYVMVLHSWLLYPAAKNKITRNGRDEIHEEHWFVKRIRLQ
jgi:hypothetical protein